ncbi:MAG: hypothetical protein U0S13_04025 [Mycobacterium sp.]
MVMVFREKEIVLPRFTVPPILLALSLVNRVRNKVVFEEAAGQ